MFGRGQHDGIFVRALARAHSALPAPMQNFCCPKSKQTFFLMVQRTCAIACGRNDFCACQGIEVSAPPACPVFRTTCFPNHSRRHADRTYIYCSTTATGCAYPFSVIAQCGTRAILPSTAYAYKFTSASQNRAPISSDSLHLARKGLFVGPSLRQHPGEIRFCA
jgi:hypothetical protein